MQSEMEDGLGSEEGEEASSANDDQSEMRAKELDGGDVDDQELDELDEQ